MIFQQEKTVQKPLPKSIFEDESPFFEEQCFDKLLSLQVQREKQLKKEEPKEEELPPKTQFKQRQNKKKQNKKKGNQRRGLSREEQEIPLRLLELGDLREDLL